MGVMVRFGKQKAFLRRGEWICANKELEDRLNDVTYRWIQETGGPPIDGAHQERTVAEEISARLGGRVASQVRSSPARDRAIYINRRQLDFDFT